MKILQIANNYWLSMQGSSSMYLLTVFLTVIPKYIFPTIYCNSRAWGFYCSDSNQPATSTNFATWSDNLNMAVDHEGGNVDKFGSKVHHVDHVEDIVIVGGGIGGLGFAAALHKYVSITPPPSYCLVQAHQVSRKFKILLISLICLNCLITNDWVPN